MKILLISYYWPPSGGAGVQRWVKLTKYLTRLGIECFVLTVDESASSYQELDESLVDEVHPGVKLIKTKSFEPTNIYARLVGKNKVPSAGFSNVNNHSVSQRIVNGIRSNFFIPDPRIGWNKYAYKKALGLIREEKINTVITTSPPHSTQLIGLRLKKKLDITWISDLRDPWTDIYYYKLLNHSFYSHRINLSLERKVLENADYVVTVSKGCKELFEKKTDKIKQPIHIIQNGYDHEDFEGIQKIRKDNVFNIVYTGGLTEQYDLTSFIEVLGSLNGRLHYKLELVGSVDTNTIAQLDAADINYMYINRVPHNKVLQYQLSADLLLLVIPNIKHANGIVTGKIFEYLATSVPILGIGPKQGDAAQILRDSKTGFMFERHEKEAMLNYLTKISQREPQTTKVETFRYQRIFQAKQYADIIRTVQVNE